MYPTNPENKMMKKVKKIEITDDNHGRSFDDGDGLDGFLLVEFGTRLFDFSEDVGHSGLEPGESGEVARLFLVVFRE